MADHVAAAQAVYGWLRSRWTTTPIADPDTPINPFPPTDSDGNPAPWVSIRLDFQRARLVAPGALGQRQFEDRGEILISYCSPIGFQDAIVLPAAVALGEIFRAVRPFTDGNGSYLRTLGPRIESPEVDALWRQVVVKVPFEFRHQG